MRAGRFYASAEGVVLLLALIVSGDLTHLTWWAITILAVHDFHIALFEKELPAMDGGDSIVEHCSSCCRSHVPDALQFAARCLP